MPRKVLKKIQGAVRDGNYYLTHHANEEMSEEGLTIFDIESALLNGKITRIEKGELLGTKYTIKGLGLDGQTEIKAVGRFTETKAFLIITVYPVRD